MYIDSSAIIGEVGHLNATDASVIEAVVTRIRYISREHSAPLNVVLDGVGTMDMIERRRRAAYVTSPNTQWDSRINILPGSGFSKLLNDRVKLEGWIPVSFGGACVSTLSRVMREIRDDARVTDCWMYARDQEVKVLSCMHGFQSTECSEANSWAHLQKIKHSEPYVGDLVTCLLHILKHGGLVVDIPGLQVDGQILNNSFQDWMNDDQPLEKEVATKLDRARFSTALDLCVSHTETCPSALNDMNFPHGNVGVCGQFVDALDRELSYLQGFTVTDETSTYLHGCAPSPTDLINHLTYEQGSLKCISRLPEFLWQPEWQLVLVMPRAHACTVAVVIHTDLTLGCVHMFPLRYTVWWGTYPLLPAIDHTLLEIARLGSGIHRALKPLDI